MHITINPDTGALERIGRDDLYTRAEVAGIRLDYPFCGAKVTIAPVDAGSLSNMSDPRRFRLGRWTWPNAAQRPS